MCHLLKNLSVADLVAISVSMVGNIVSHFFLSADLTLYRVLEIAEDRKFPFGEGGSMQRKEVHSGFLPPKQSSISLLSSSQMLASTKWIQ